MLCTVGFLGPFANDTTVGNPCHKSFNPIVKNVSHSIPPSTLKRLGLSLRMLSQPAWDKALLHPVNPGKGSSDAADDLVEPKGLLGHADGEGQVSRFLER